MVVFARSLDGRWRSFAARFALALAVLAPLWVALAPLYSGVLAALASAAAPVIERDAGARYAVRGAKIAVLRRIDAVGDGPLVTGWQGLWDARVTANGVVLAAAILATPGFSTRRRVKALGVGSAALAGTHLLNVMVNALYTQARQAAAPQHTPAGAAELLNAVSFFFDTTGAVLFPLVILAGVIVAYWDEAGDLRGPRNRSARRRAARVVPGAAGRSS